MKDYSKFSNFKDLNYNWIFLDIKTLQLHPHQIILDLNSFLYYLFNVICQISERSLKQNLPGGLNVHIIQKLFMDKMTIHTLGNINCIISNGNLISVIEDFSGFNFAQPLMSHLAIPAKGERYLVGQLWGILYIDPFQSWIDSYILRRKKRGLEVKMFLITYFTFIFCVYNWMSYSSYTMNSNLTEGHINLLHMLHKIGLRQQARRSK